MMHGGPARFALSALDIALWDIKGKVEGKPIWRLLGGTGKDRVPAYASLLRVVEPDLIKRVATAAMARGDRQIKLHEKTVEAVAAARDAVGPDIALMVDTNCAWTADQARKQAAKGNMWMQKIQDSYWAFFDKFAKYGDYRVQ